MTILSSFNSSTDPADAIETFNDILASIVALKAKVAATPPIPSFGLATLSQNEGNSGTSSFVFPVNLDKVWSSDISYEVVVAPTGSNPADATDFVGGVFPRFLVTIPAGSTTTNANVSVAGDSSIEPNENFAVRLYRVAASSVGTILNDDTLKTLTASVTSGFVGTSLNSTISGLTSGSTVALSGAGSPGLSVQGAIITGTPTKVGDVNIIETPAGGGTSKTTSGAITISAASQSNRFDSTGWSFDSTSFPSFDMAA
ncbi:hypothetical protein [Sphingomonas echinoides]|uniref:hypothetical protein n=1 Tax=Sphingomonas echinoides TaxID=59803 RepID=UPI0024130D5C|nr:hypothetical protein [Sphingomonas echinoides]